MENDKTINFENTKYDMSTKEVLQYIKNALEEKGYDYNNQIIGYLLSGDPSYIPRHNNARTVIKSIQRDKLIEELLTFYMENNLDD